MIEFSYCMPSRIVLGKGSTAKLKQYVQGDRVLIICDPFLYQSGAAQRIGANLEGCTVSYFHAIEPNPSCESVDEAAAAARALGAQTVVGIGGGSSMDVSKIVSCLAGDEGSIYDYYSGGTRKLSQRTVRLICIPTTAGTGSEVTFDAVITDTEAHEKLNILDIKIAPRVALVDPTVLKGLPEKVMASTGVDALIHAVEAYTCKAASPMTDAFALYAIDLIGANIREAVYKRTPESCKAMMLGSTMAGIAFGYSDVAAVHCIAEALGGRYDTPHGVPNAMVLSTVTEFNIPSAVEKYAEIARHLGVDTAGMTTEEAAYRCVDAMKSICSDVKIPRMRDFDVIDPKDFQALAEASFRNMSTPNNPRELTVQDFFDLLTKAYNA